MATQSDLYAEVIEGDLRSGFWQPEGGEWCGELFLAVRRACALPSAEPATRWLVVERALRDLATEYAEANAYEGTYEDDAESASRSIDRANAREANRHG